MKSFLNKTAFCFFIVSCSVASAAENLEYVPGELLIRYKKTLGIAAVSSRLQKEGLKFLKTLEKPKNQKDYELIHARIVGTETVEEAIGRLSLDPTVESVQPNFKYKTLATIPNDTYFDMQWALKNTAQDVVDYDVAGPTFPSSEGLPAVSGKDMNLPMAWDTITNCNSVTVAVVDSGVKYDHEDLAANMWDGSAGGFPNHGYDTFNTDNNPMDDNGHGTHVAGTIGAVGNNAKGTTGVCWAVKLMAIKVMNSVGFGTTVTIAAGINWAVAHDAHVINLSLGGGSSDAALLASIQNARDSDVVVVSAAGNDGTNNSSAPQYPCNHREVNTICVAATAQNNRLASFSNFSTTYVDVGAPGINILSPYLLSRTITDVTFTTGWTAGPTVKSVWAPQTVGGNDAITVPATWNGGGTLYEDGSDARLSQDFNFSGDTKVWFQREMLNNLAFGDSVKTYVKNGITDPFAGGTTLNSVTYLDNTGTTSYADIFDVSPECATDDCTIGFHFVSDTPATGHTISTGAVINSMKLISFAPGTAGYNMSRGTSMAAPHVSGVAALVRARNPNYTAADVVNAIKAGGTVNAYLTLKTTSGNSVSATGALSYIRSPTGVTAVQD
jgi:thermitase